MKKKTQKIIICISLFVMLFVAIAPSFNSVFAEVNSDYAPKVKVTDNALDSKIKESLLLDIIANMINAVASLAETLLGGVFKTLTHDNIFPWADRIIFNGIPFLDINFLNPSDNSLFKSNGGDSILGTVIKQVYSTIFSLAILFLGVAVGIMAIRLAISTIASEKAKYKQAIVNWATCIVMLFLMHYILAFVFWVNEQMVQIASNILINTIKDHPELEKVDFTDALNAVLKPEERVKNYCDSAVTDYNVATEALNLLQNRYTIIVSAWNFLTSLGENMSANQEAKEYSDEIMSSPQNIEVANRLIMMTDNYVPKRLTYSVDNNGNDIWLQYSQKEQGANKLMARIALPRLLMDTRDAVKVKNMLDSLDGNNSDDYKKELDRINKLGYYEGEEQRKLFFDEDAYINSPDFKVDLSAFAYVYAHKEEAEALLNFYIKTPGYKINSGDNPSEFQSSANAVWRVFSSLSTLGISDLANYIENNGDESIIYTAILNDDNAKHQFAKLRLEIDGYIIGAATGVNADATDIIANLGQFFKQSAYVYTTEVSSEDGKETITGWRASKLSVTGALLYAIFVFQSCLYFITYVKRLFYVIMLAMFGPIVVIYDFFMKSAAG